MWMHQKRRDSDKKAAPATTWSCIECQTVIVTFIVTFIVTLSTTHLCEARKIGVKYDEGEHTCKQMDTIKMKNSESATSELVVPHKFKQDG